MELQNITDSDIISLLCSINRYIIVKKAFLSYDCRVIELIINTLDKLTINEFIYNIMVDICPRKSLCDESMNYIKSMIHMRSFTESCN